MNPALAADLVVGLHFAFILFALLGAALLLRWPRLIWLHVPALAWGTWIELSGRICPLTPLEMQLREAAGEQGYAGGFIDHYLTPIIYPEGLTRDTQMLFAGILLAVNALFYGLFLSAKDALMPLVTLDTIFDPIEAQIILSRLHSGGIEAVLFDAGISSLIGSGLSGVRVMVLDEDEAEARALLAVA